jgi:predicted AAA+ superfamily ATPase
MDFNKVELLMKEMYGKTGVYFFDEIQNVDKWEKFIRYLIDKKERIVLTGSNASLLSKEWGTKLTGRHLQAEMFPFSFKEFLSLKEQKPSIQSFEEYFQKGGFPEYLKKENPAILHELLSDVVMKDIAVRYGIRNTTMLNKIAIYCISNVGKSVSYNSLKNMFDIKSVQSIIDYMSYLENTYLIAAISCFNYSYRKQQVNPKKIYSIDNGLSYANSASFSKDKGRMLENVVFGGLRRRYRNIFYFQEKFECDFIIKEKEIITQAYQVCFEFNEETKGREIQGLLIALKEFNLKQGIILTYNQEDEFVIESKEIIVMPVWKWLLKR